MELKVNLFPLGEDSLEAVASLIPESKRKVVSARWSVSLDDPVFRDNLMLGESTSGFWVSVDTRLSTAELQETSHFEVVCRKVTPESERDFQANEAARQRAPLLEKGGLSPIRLASGFTLTKIHLKPNMVSAIGDQAGEYLIGSATADVFSSQGFSGFSLGPINNPRLGAPHEGFFQILSDSIMNPAEVDCSIEVVQSDSPAEHGELRHLGCLAYRQESLIGIPDFSRTAEPWESSFGSPAWVVSSRVVRAFRESKLRGWAFRPILVRGSDLYSAYRRSWTRLTEWVGQCSRSQFDGGR